MKLNKLTLVLNCLFVLPAIYANSNRIPNSNLSKVKKFLVDNLKIGKNSIISFVNNKVSPKLKDVTQRVKDFFVQEENKFSKLKPSEKILHCAIAGGPLAILMLSSINKKLAYAGAITWPFALIALTRIEEQKN